MLTNARTSSAHTSQPKLTVPVAWSTTATRRSPIEGSSAFTAPILAGEIAGGGTGWPVSRVRRSLSKPRGLPAHGPSDFAQVRTSFVLYAALAAQVSPQVPAKARYTTVCVPYVSQPPHPMQAGLSRPNVAGTPTGGPAGAVRDGRRILGLAARLQTDLQPARQPFAQLVDSILTRWSATTTHFSRQPGQKRIRHRLEQGGEVDGPA